MFDKINLLNSPVVQTQQTKLNDGQNSNQNFKSIFKDALQNVSAIENHANMQQKMLVEGKANDLHNVMLAAQKATLTIEATVQIQQKVIDTYNEVMRMQI